MICVACEVDKHDRCPAWDPEIFLDFLFARNEDLRCSCQDEAHPTSLLEDKDDS